MIDVKLLEYVIISPRKKYRKFKTAIISERKDFQFWSRDLLAIMSHFNLS